MAGKAPRKPTPDVSGSISSSLEGNSIQGVGERLRKYTERVPQQLRPWLEFRPSVIYGKAKEKLAYRLSEATFASLIVGYLFVFVSSTAGWDNRTSLAPRESRQDSLREAGESETGNTRSWPSSHQTGGPTRRSFVLERIREPIQFLGFISAILLFTFLTTALYLKYHITFLTMASYSSSVMNRDFAIAVAQGIGFGLAVRWPGILCLVVSAILLFCQWVQNREVFHLLRWFATYPFKEKDFEERFPNADATNPRPLPPLDFKEESIHELLRKHALNDWVRVPKEHYWYTLAMMVLGVVLATCTYVVPNVPSAFLSSALTPDLMRVLCVGCNLALAIGVMFFSWRRLGSVGQVLDGFEREFLRTDETYDATTTADRYTKFGFDIRYMQLISEAGQR